MPVPHHHHHRHPHPGGHSKTRVPGPKTGEPQEAKDANGPAGQQSHSKPVVSPLKTAAPITITAEILGEIVPIAGIPDAGTVVKNLNDMVSAAKIKTALAEAMLIAQVVVETGSFTDVRADEQVDIMEVYNPDESVSATFKTVENGWGRGATARYLPHPAQTRQWRISKAAYDKAKAAYAKEQPGKDFDASKLWKPVKVTDYLPGDQEYPRWQIWYDPTSPRPQRAKKAVSMGNTNAKDGQRYHGRGLVQLTWQCNYKDAGNDLGKTYPELAHLENNPDLAADPVAAVKIAGWYWSKHGGNRDAVADTSAALTKVSQDINGGGKGLEQRKGAYNKTKAAFLKRIPVLPEK